MNKKKLISIGVITICLITALVLAYYSHKHKYTVQVPETPKSLTRLNGEPFAFDGEITEWGTSPVMYYLTKKAEGANNGGVWVNQIEQGIVIAGYVKDAKPKWPKGSYDDMALYDHVEVWLAGELPVDLPQIGWAHQFGENYLESKDDCFKEYNDADAGVPIDNPEECAQWYDQQIPFRSALQKTFVRQWQIAPQVVKETYATDAFKKLTETPNQYAHYPIAEEYAALKPGTTTPDVRIKTKLQGGYTYEIFIPWEAMPPVRATELNRLRFMVDVFSPGTGSLKYGPFSSTASARVYGQPDTFNEYTFEAPRTYNVTACSMKEGTERPSIEWAYMFPTQKNFIDNPFYLENKPLGYQYSPSLSQNSPSVSTLPFFSIALDNGGHLCGSPLTYSHSGTTIQSSYAIDKNVEYKKLPNGDYLVKQGPDVGIASALGTGTCGSCPIVGFEMFYIDTKKFEIKKASNFKFQSMYDTGDVDFDISSDWKKITQYNAVDGSYIDGEIPRTWSSVSYCFNETMHIYNVCGTKNNVQPPSPRNFSAYPENR